MTTARDIMHAGAECINEDETLLVAARMMRDLDVGSLPICGNDDKLHGIVTDRDIVIKCCAEGKDLSRVKAAELANGAPHCVSADADVDQVLRTMQTHQIRRVPVIEGDRLVGMISESDVARNLSEDQIAAFVESVYASR